MIHHLLYFAPGRVEDSQGSCWTGAGFIARPRRGAPERQLRLRARAERRAQVRHRQPAGRRRPRPNWCLVAMVMNHVKKPKTVYVRTTRLLHRGGAPARLSDRRRLPTGNGMAYDVPGRRRARARTSWTQSTVDRRRSTAASCWRRRTSTAAASTTRSRATPATAGSTRRASTTARPNHIYNTIRPILHEPGPIATGTFGVATGCPDPARARCSRRRAVHDNAQPARGRRWGSGCCMLVKDDSVGQCDPMPTTSRRSRRPRRFDKTPNHAPEGAAARTSRPGALRRLHRRPAHDRRRATSGPAQIRARRSARRSRGSSRARSRTPSRWPTGRAGFSSLYIGQHGRQASRSRRPCPAPTG